MSQRRLSAALLALALCACATSPAPVDPRLAGISLHAPPADVISAQRLDGERLSRGNDLRVIPGAHELLVRYEYDSRQGSGLFGEPRRVVCELRLRYAHFEAGRHYRLKARPLALKAQGWLYGADGDEPLTRAEVLRCRPF
ncbi:MAG TPA: hypothetical protein VL178_16220 [Pseudomonas sp.]|nr:hypothetical protein [Pseudomonas sp.]